MKLSLNDSNRNWNGRPRRYHFISAIMTAILILKMIRKINRLLSKNENENAKSILVKENDCGKLNSPIHGNHNRYVSPVGTHRRKNTETQQKTQSASKRK